MGLLFRIDKYVNEENFWKCKQWVPENYTNQTTVCADLLYRHFPFSFPWLPHCDVSSISYFHINEISTADEKSTQQTFDILYFLGRVYKRNSLLYAKKSWMDLIAGWEMFFFFTFLFCNGKKSFTHQSDWRTLWGWMDKKLVNHNRNLV